MKILQYNFDNKTVLKHGKTIIDGVLRNILESVELNNYKAVIVIIQPQEENMMTNILLFENEQEAWQRYEEQKIIANIVPVMVEYYSIKDFKKLLGES